MFSSEMTQDDGKMTKLHFEQGSGILERPTCLKLKLMKVVDAPASHFARRNLFQ
jgi:hypothetical protein